MPEPDASPRHRILLAASQPELRDVLDRLLRDAAYETSHAVDGIAALRAVARLAPSLLVLDAHLAPVDGLLALELIRAVADDLPVVLLSSVLEPGLIARAAELGVAAVLRKPFRNAELLGAVAGALAGRSAVGRVAPGPTPAPVGADEPHRVPARVALEP